MGKIKNPKKVKLFIGAIFSQESKLILEDLKEKLVKKFGPIDLESKIIPFDCTTYYEKETGPHLQKIFFSFKRLIDPERLAEIKIWTNQLETKLAQRYKTFPRPVNLDPGYLTLANLVLATTKGQAHRIYLRKGIYAEVTLLYQKGKFVPLPWTYPDFRQDSYHQFFLEVRKIYKKQLT